MRCRSPDRTPLVACGACQPPPAHQATPPPGRTPGPPSRRCRGTRRGPSSAARPGPATATPSAWWAAAAGSSSRSSTSPSRRASRPTGTSPTGCSVCPSRRSASAASRRTTTAPRCRASRSRPSGVPGRRALAAICPTSRSSSPTAAASTSTTTTYAEIVGRIIDDEIGNGEGANLVIGRNYRATIADWGADKALTIFRRLLERERGAYWTFLVFTGDRYLVGASPERHVSVHGGEVRMNPISGTFRVGGVGDPAERQAPAARLPRRREGDLRALHGRRRRAQDDVRHLQRGRPDPRAVSSSR